MNIGITIMLKDGGYDVVLIPIKFMGELAKSIKGKGSEYIHTATRSVEVVGFMVTGKQTGERIIVYRQERGGYSLMGILHQAIVNPNGILRSEEDEAEYRTQKAKERYEKQQARQRSHNQSKHVLDPDREWEEDECPSCGETKELFLVTWLNNPSPSSGIDSTGVYICQECSDKAEEYADKMAL